MIGYKDPDGLVKPKAFVVLQKGAGSEAPARWNDRGKIDRHRLGASGFRA